MLSSSYSYSAPKGQGNWQKGSYEYILAVFLYMLLMTLTNFLFISCILNLKYNFTFLIINQYIMQTLPF